MLLQLRAAAPQAALALSSQSRRGAGAWRAAQAQQVAATFELGSDRPAGGGIMAVCSWGGPTKSSCSA